MQATKHLTLKNADGRCHSVSIGYDAPDDLMAELSADFLRQLDAALARLAAQRGLTVQHSYVTFPAGAVPQLPPRRREWRE